MIYRCTICDRDFDASEVAAMQLLDDSEGRRAVIDTKRGLFHSLKVKRVQKVGEVIAPSVAEDSQTTLSDSQTETGEGYEF